MVELVAIGCSAGGVDALSCILPAFVAHTRLSVVVVLHLPSESSSSVSAVFGPKCSIPVKEAEDKEPIRPGVIYFAPPAYHLMIERDRSFSLSVEDPVWFSRPSIDVLFESAAIAYRDRLVALVLTGANEDGARGLKEVKELGGQIWVEDPKTAAHSIMPLAALELAQPGRERVRSLEELAQWIARLSKERG